VPVLRIRREGGQECSMKKMLTAGLTAGLVVLGIGSAMATAPTASADCTSGMVWGNGGGQCDGPFYPDGSFQRCVSVYVLGIGGSNCYVVPPPASAAAPLPPPGQLA
jgi:hypothetical protein